MPSKTTTKKQVRFAYLNTYHPAPNLLGPPGLTYSSSTAPSSSGPITPPNAPLALPYRGVPYVTSQPAVPIYPYPPLKAPSASRHTGRVAVHPYLNIDGIVWDLMDHPSMGVRKRHNLSSRALSEPASEPPLPFIIITSPHLRWTFKVYPSNGRYVTVGDVLDMLYRSLRINVSQPEFQSLPSENDRRRATHAYEERYRRLRSSKGYHEEKRAGMKRIDFLMGHTRFVGVTIDGRPDEWHLRVS